MVGFVTQFVISAAFIVVAGILLTRFADRIAEDTNLGRLFVGAILLAAATSLPELVVDLNAVTRRNADLAVGDLLGSSLFNLLILAVFDSIFRPSRRAFTSDAAAFAPTGMLAIALTSLVGIGIASRFDVEWFGMGLTVWVIFACYVFGLTFALRSPLSEDVKQKQVQTARQRKRVINSGVGYLASTILLVTAAPYLVAAAANIAEASGIGHSFVGTTLVAFATSLPELVATWAAMRMGAPTLALGNIFGSNIFNMVLFLPLDAVYKGLLLHDVRSVHGVTAFFVVLITSFAVMGQLSPGASRRFRSEGIAGAVVLALIALYFMRAI